LINVYSVLTTVTKRITETTRPSGAITNTTVPLKKYQESQQSTTSTTIQKVILPWQTTKPVNMPGVAISTVIKPGLLYKSKECASDGEPILKVVGIGITEKPPTKCCEGLKLCSFLVTDEKEFIEYQGVLSQILGYCKISCPENDTTKDLLPNPTKPKTLLESISD
jgi:hypothetical protein